MAKKTAKKASKKAASVKKRAGKKAVKKAVAKKKTTKRKQTVKKAAKKKTTKKAAAKKVAKKKVVKKKAAKKKASAKKASAPRKPHLTKDELQKFRIILYLKRKEILGNVTEIEAEALRQSRLDAAGDLSSMPIHMADLGTDNYEQEFALGLMDNERKLLRAVDDALIRIEEGTYGYCEGTGKPIRKARLKAKPWARFSVEFARLIEEGKAPGYEQQ